MGGIIVVERSGTLVVDSRLVAEALGIQHKNFLAMIEKHRQEAESDGFAPLAFETRMVKLPQGGSYKERWTWLDEKWANYFMTLSRNTKKVRAAKRQLVKAFSQAKQEVQEAGFQSQLQQSCELPVTMPTPEEIDYIKSRSWEKIELDGKPIDWAEVAHRSGFERAMRAANRQDFKK